MRDVTPPNGLKISLLGLPAHELLDRFASPEPTPGGGSAAALAGATGGALVAMVCAMPKTRSGSSQERERLDTARGWLRESSARLRRLVDEDAAAYDAVVAAYRLPKGNEAEKASRQSAVTAALTRATEVPLQTAEACLVVLSAAVEAVAHGNPNALSDARTGGALALAGLLGALDNVRANLRDADPATPPVREKAEALRRDGLRHAAALGLPLTP